VISWVPEIAALFISPFLALKLQPMLERMTELWTPLAQFGCDEKSSMKSGAYYMTRVVSRSAANGLSDLYLISLNTNYMSVFNVPFWAVHITLRGGW